MKADITGKTVCALVSSDGASIASTQVAINTAIDEILYIQDLARMTSAYQALSPKCDERTKALYRIAPAAREARMFPNMADSIYLMLKKWASGELHGAVLPGWSTIGANGLTGEEMFEGLWARFVKQTDYRGRETTLGSVYHAAKAVGWVYEAFESVSGSTKTAD